MIVHEPDFIFWARYVEPFEPYCTKTKWGGEMVTTIVSLTPTLASTYSLVAPLKQVISLQIFHAFKF